MRQCQLMVGLTGLLLFATTVRASDPAVLIHYYPLNTDASDKVGSADGTLIGGASIASGDLLLSGAGQYVQFPSYIIPSSDFSVVFNARETVPTNNYVELISQGYSGAPGFYIGHDTSHNFRLGDDIQTTGIAFPTDGGWHQYALTSDPSLDQTILYIDGSKVGSFGIAAPAPAVGTDTRFGGQFEAYGEYLQGQMDMVSIYSGVLTPTQIVGTVPEPTSICLHRDWGNSDVIGSSAIS